MTFLNGRNKIKPKRVSFRLFFMCVLYVGVSNKSFSFSLDFGFIQSFEKSSNFLKVPDVQADGQFEETIRTSSVYFKLDEDISYIKSNIDLNISYLDFEKGLASNVTRNTLSSDLLWVVTKNRYFWYLKDVYSQTRTDATELITETNTQNVNQFMAGPKFVWQVGDSALNLEFYIINYDYSVTDNDTTSVTSNIDWVRKVSGGISLSLRYSTEYISYDSSHTLEDYDKSTLGINFEYKRVANYLNAFLGKTLLNNTDGGTTTTASLLYTRQLTRYSSLGFNYSNNLSNENDSIDTQGTAISGVFFDKRYSVTYKKNNRGSGYDMKYEEYQKDDYDSVDEDKRVISQIVLFKNLSARSRVSVTYSDTSLQVVDSDDQDYEDDAYERKVGYQKLFNNKLTMNLFVSEVLVKSDLYVRQYFDKRIGISFSIAR